MEGVFALAFILPNIKFSFKGEVECYWQQHNFLSIFLQFISITYLVLCLYNLKQNSKLFEQVDKTQNGRKNRNEYSHLSWNSNSKLLIYMKIS